MRVEERVVKDCEEKKERVEKECELRRSASRERESREEMRLGNKVL